MTGSKSKLGIQTQWDSGEALRYNRKVKPAAVMGINVTKVEWYLRLELDNPGVKRIYRHHPNSDRIPGLARWDIDPEQAAADFVDFLKGHLEGCLGWIDLIAGDNEFILGPDHEPPDRIEKADRFMAAFVREANLFLGKGVCVGNFNVGHWGPETVDYFPHTLTAIQAQALQGERLSYFCFHEYNWPLLRDDTRWRTGKFLRAMPPILEKYCSIHAMITEVGIDKASRVVGEHAGWRKAHVDIDIAVDAYCGDYGLAWYNDLLNQADYVAAALIFGCGMGDWRSMGFDIMNNPDDTAVLNRIKTYPVVAPPEPPPEPPNGDDEMEVKIYDMLDQLQNKEWMHRLYGVDWERAEVEPGQLVYRLVLLREKEGPASLVTRVVDENDQPMEGMDVAFYWSGAPDPPDPPTEVYPHDWHRNFVHGPTNVNGDVGPGMGTGAYHGPGECGPHQVWVRDPDISSDRCYCLGMLAGTFHRHMDQRFKLVVHEGEPPTPPNGNLLAEAKAVNEKLDRIIQLLEQAPPEPPPPEPDTDFSGKYFNNITLDGDPVFTRTDRSIDFDWGVSSPDPRVTPNYFSARWVALKTFEEATYRFMAYVDDGIRVFVDDVLILDAWRDQPPTTHHADVAMIAGQHTIRVEYYERAGGATCRLGWEEL